MATEVEYFGYYGAWWDQERPWQEHRLTRQEHRVPSTLRTVYVKKRSISNGILVAQGSVDGHPVDAIPDTGAGHSFVSSSFAKRLGYRPPPDQPEQGHDISFCMANGKVIKSIGAINAAWIFACDPRRAWSVSFQIINDFAYDVVLGIDFLNTSDTMSQHWARLTRIPRPSWATKVLFTSSIGSVSQRLDGEVGGLPVQALADSGSESNLVSLSFALDHPEWRKSIDTSDVRLLQFPDGSTETTKGSVWAYWLYKGASLSSGRPNATAFQFHILESCVHDVILGQDALEETDAFSNHAASFLKFWQAPEVVAFNLVIWLPVKRSKELRQAITAEAVDTPNEQASDGHPEALDQQRLDSQYSNSSSQTGIELTVATKYQSPKDGAVRMREELERRAVAERKSRHMPQGPERDAAIAQDE
ncbi:hypothetical protein CLIM01_07156 [Colletotrichum limetticola]|uniref:Peptidase A2 domain-containing protein n=1 Tax=Colletotrichum limetticola TaxID=1209924 RepID=A0ABQ9PVC8_9PEZI|nr:hypothetical protein CLIM01_07156 [Colletotrichum limetticola]